MNLQNDEIINNLKSLGEKIYLVGGTIRDFYINPEKISLDKDIIVTSCPAIDFAKKLEQAFKGTLITLDEENKIYRFIFEDKINYVDITSPVGDSLNEDLSRRDFTINAIALDLSNNEIIDLFNGIEDIKNRKIRHISEKNFTDDSLRLLRAFRFKALTGFDIDNETTELIKKHSKLISKPAKERINYEILKMFGGKYTDKAILNADKTGLIDIIFPAIPDVKKVPKNSHHHLDLFNHSVETVKQVEILYENSSPEVKEHLERVDFGGNTRLAHLKLSAFLHDIGKFSTWTIDETGRHRFIMHDEVGEKLAKEFLKENKYSKKQIEYISEMVKKHIYPTSIAMGAVTDNGINYKSYMKYIRKMGDNSIDAIILAKADRLSAQGPEITEEMTKHNLECLDSLLNYYLSVRDTLTPLPKLLTGNEIMELLNIKPSRKLGEIISKMEEAQISGDITSKEDAVNFVSAFK